MAFTTPIPFLSPSLHRWFDKAFSLIVAEGGLSAINFEHAWGDGVAVLRFMTEVYRDTTQNPYVPPAANPSPSGEGVEMLQFELSDRLKAAVEAARTEVSTCGEVCEWYGMYDCVE